MIRAARRAAAAATPASPCCTATSPRTARHQAGRRVPAPAPAPRAARWSSTRSRTCTPASTTRTSTSTPTRCWCCAAAARRATRACPRSPTCRCRRSCSSRASATWCAICDGRMSGTAYGTVVLHVTPEAAAGGPLALVRTGDVIVLDVPAPPARRRRPAPTSCAARAPDRPRPSALRRARAAAGSGSTSTHVHAGRHRRRPRLPARLERRGRQPRVALTRRQPRTLAPARRHIRRECRDFPVA